MKLMLSWTTCLDHEVSGLLVSGVLKTVASGLMDCKLLCTRSPFPRIAESAFLLPHRVSWNEGQVKCKFSSKVSAMKPGGPFAFSTSCQSLVKAFLSHSHGYSHSRHLLTPQICKFVSLCLEFLPAMSSPLPSDAAPIADTSCGLSWVPSSLLHLILSSPHFSPAQASERQLVS